MSKLNNVISKVLNVPEGEINDETSPDNTVSWDSFISMVLVSELENNFSVSLTMDDQIGIRCVADIKKILIKSGIDKEEL
jgi:acyl carrier protein